jgi:hypothetical protein
MYLVLALHHLPLVFLVIFTKEIASSILFVKVSKFFSLADFPVPSLEDIPLAEQITPETPPAEKTTSDELDKLEDQLPMTNEKDITESGNGSIPPQKEAELPKSKGQLRLVPYESLLSPSFLHAERVEEDASTANQSPISPSKTSNKPQAMVAIPERNLEDLNILARTLTADSAPTQPLTEAGNLNSSKI